MDKHKYRQARGSIGLVLAFVWIVYWWINFDAAKSEARAACTGGDDLIGNIGKSLCEGTADNTFVGKIMLVVLVSPLAFWVAHYIARWWVGQEERADEQRKEMAESARIKQHQQTLRIMGEEASAEASATQRNNDRHELITRLGAVDDQLIVLENETEPDRITRIKMSIAQALREVDAKFTDQELQQLMSAHNAIRQRVTRTLEEMRRLGLGDSRQYQDLSGMFGLGGTTETQRAYAADKPIT